mmetsp:Transcript_15033/g.41082  ORF Transcript_15033/g.41082 Transcript_15033/m.41082 type:complete len:87 (+) Transcript_15033:427-687(+)
MVAAGAIFGNAVVEMHAAMATPVIVFPNPDKIRAHASFTLPRTFRCSVIRGFSPLCALLCEAMHFAKLCVFALIRFVGNWQLCNGR